MTTQVNLYLDRARMAARIGVIGRVTEVRPVGKSIVRALDRIYRDKELTYSLDCPSGARFQGERQDLEEMLGNLLDNASKWARSQGQPAVDAAAAADGDGRAIGSKSAWRMTGRASPPSSSPSPSRAAGVWTRPSPAPASATPSSPIWPIATAASSSWPAPEAGGLSARLTLPLAVS